MSVVDTLLRRHRLLVIFWGVLLGILQLGIFLIGADSFLMGIHFLGAIWSSSLVTVDAGFGWLWIALGFLLYLAIPICSGISAARQPYERSAALAGCRTGLLAFVLAALSSMSLFMSEAQPAPASPGDRAPWLAGFALHVFILQVIVGYLVYSLFGNALALLGGVIGGRIGKRQAPFSDA